MNIPDKKSRRDGAVDVLNNESGGMLVMRGNYTIEQIVTAAIEQKQIDECDREYWLTLSGCDRYYQSWFKATPDGTGEYKMWHFARKEPCSGAYFASVIEKY